jgi:putative flippase GtrA
VARRPFARRSASTAPAAPAETAAPPSAAAPLAPPPRVGLAARLRGVADGSRDDGLSQLVRYGVVAAVALAVDFGSLVALTEGAGLHYLVAAALGFLAGLVTNYLLSVHWVFARRRLADRRAEFAVFAGVGVAGLVWNVVLIAGFTELAGLHYAASKAVATVLVFAWNFGVRRWLLFR